MWQLAVVPLYGHLQSDKRGKDTALLALNQLKPIPTAHQSASQELQTQSLLGPPLCPRVVQRSLALLRQTKSVGRVLRWWILEPHRGAWGSPLFQNT